MENVDKPYIVKWSLGDASQNNIITLATEDKKVTVTSPSNIKGSVRVPVNVDVYCVDDYGEKVGDPVAGATVDCWVEQEYYTLELEGFNSALQKGEYTPRLFTMDERYFYYPHYSPEMKNPGLSKEEEEALLK